MAICVAQFVASVDCSSHKFRHTRNPSDGKTAYGVAGFRRTYDIEDYPSYTSACVPEDTECTADYEIDSLILALLASFLVLIGVSVTCCYFCARRKKMLASTPAMAAVDVELQEEIERQERALFKLKMEAAEQEF